jgi:hypothetical protein
MSRSVRGGRIWMYDCHLLRADTQHLHHQLQKPKESRTFCVTWVELQHKKRPHHNPHCADPWRLRGLFWLNKIIFLHNSNHMLHCHIMSKHDVYIAHYLKLNHSQQDPMNMKQTNCGALVTREQLEHWHSNICWTLYCCK